MPLITRDAARFGAYFPIVELIEPPRGDAEKGRKWDQV